MTKPRPRSGRNWVQTLATSHRRAWVVTPEVEATLIVGPFDNPDDPGQEDHEATQAGYEPVLFQLRNRFTFLNIDLSLMTVEEIAAIKVIFDIAVERGIQVSALLDARAQAILESGNKAVPMRAFRMKPTVIVRHLEIEGIEEETHP